MSVNGFTGLRATDDWTTNQRPKNFRQMMLRIAPNGDMPLTGLSSMSKSESVNDPSFTYFSKSLADQGGAFTATEVYDTNLLSTKVTGAPAVGVIVYVKVLLAVVEHFRAGHTILVIDQSDETNRLFGDVVEQQANGANSFLGVKTIVSNGVIEAADYVEVAGNSNAEGAPIPEALTYDPIERENKTQIWRTPLDITRTARKTFLRTGDAYTELKLEILLYHGVEIERAVLTGEKSKTVGSNNKPKRTMQGAISFVREFQSTNVADFVADHSATTWIAGGDAWLDAQLEINFRHGASEKLGVCGSGVMLGVADLAKQKGRFEMTTMSLGYGIKVVRYATPFGEVGLKRHPLLTKSPFRRNAILVFEPRNMKWRFIDDTHFKADDSQKKAGQVGIDGTKEEYLTEGATEWHFPETMSYLTRVGEDAP